MSATLAARAQRLASHTVAALPWLALALIVLQLLRLRSFEFTVDDAWISFRYARHLAETGVPTYNLGQAAVEGFSNPLWTVLFAVWIGLVPSVEPIIAARVVGAACAVCTVALLAWTVRRLNPQAEGGAYAAALLVASSGCLWFYAMAGLETALWCLLWSALLCICLLPSTARLRMAGALLMVLFVWSRPEALALGAVLVALAFAVGGQRHALTLLLAYLLALVALLAVRQHVFGAWLPNTYYAKPAVWQEGVEDFGRFALWGLGAVGWCILLLARPTRQVWALVAACIATAAMLVITGGDWMPGWRRWLIVELALVLAVGLQWRRGDRWASVRYTLLAGWLAMHLAAALMGRDAGRFPPDHMARLGGLAQASGLTRVAVMDIGQFGWTFRGQIIDLAGLTDAHLARRPGAHLEKADPGYVLAQRPDLVLLHLYANPHVAHPFDAPIRIRSAAERQMLAALATTDAYRLHTLAMITPRFGLAVFARRDLALSPELWGPDWQGTGAELQGNLVED